MIPVCAEVNIQTNTIDLLRFDQCVENAKIVKLAAQNSSLLIPKNYFENNDCKKSCYVCKMICLLTNTEKCAKIINTYTLRKRRLRNKAFHYLYLFHYYIHKKSTTKMWSHEICQMVQDTYVLVLRD